MRKHPKTEKLGNGRKPHPGAVLQAPRDGPGLAPLPPLGTPRASPGTVPSVTAHIKAAGRGKADTHLALPPLGTMGLVQAAGGQTEGGVQVSL